MSGKMYALEGGGYGFGLGDAKRISHRIKGDEIMAAANVAHGGGLFETMPQTVDQAIDMFDEHGIEIIELTEE